MRYLVRIAQSPVADPETWLCGPEPPNQTPPPSPLAPQHHQSPLQSTSPTPTEPPPVLPLSRLSSVCQSPTPWRIPCSLYPSLFPTGFARAGPVPGFQGDTLLLAFIDLRQVGLCFFPPLFLFFHSSFSLSSVFSCLPLSIPPFFHLFSLSPTPPVPTP